MLTKIINRIRTRKITLNGTEYTHKGALSYYSTLCRAYEKSRNFNTCFARDGVWQDMLAAGFTWEELDNAERAYIITAI